MNTTVKIIIIILILGAGVFISYKYFEQPMQEQANKYVNISIKAVDENDNNIITGYKIYLDGVESKSEKTLDKGYIFDKVFLNKSVKITNYNLPNQTYYIDKIEFSTYDEENSVKRIDLKLVNPGTLNVTQMNNITNGGDEVVNLSVKTIGVFKNPHFCFEYSVHFITIKTNESFERIDKPQRFARQYDKCFKIPSEELNNEEIIISFYYKTFGDFNRGDYFNIAFFDGEIINNDLNIDEEIGGKDIFFNATIL